MLEVIVSPEHRGEIRRITLINHDAAARELELTSYAEVVLAPRGADLGHPAFAKLFLETEWLPGPGAIVCRRRMRSATEQPLWAVHVSAVDASTRGSSAQGDVQYETDRARFLGRGRTVASPAAMDPGAVLSGTVGPVLDPIVSLRRRLRIDPGGTAVVAIVTAFAESRDEAMTLADQFREAGAATRAFELAWAQSQVEHRHHGTGADAHLYQRLASHIIFAGSALRADPSVLLRDRLGQPELWRFGISGDRPIVLARIVGSGELPLVRQLLAAHAYLRVRGLEFDLVLLDEEPGSYLDELNRQLLDTVRAAGAAERVDQPGGIFVRKTSQMSEDEHLLMEAAARVVLVGDAGRWPASSTGPSAIPRCPAGSPRRASRAVGPTSRSRRPRACCSPTAWAASRPTAASTASWSRARRRRRPAQRPAGRTTHPPSYPRLPPAPWVNVVANPSLRLRGLRGRLGVHLGDQQPGQPPDPLEQRPGLRPPGEVIYLRDEETGEVWSPTPLPVPSAQPTLVRHGQGYTAYERNTHGLAHELVLFVPPEDPVKLIRSEDQERRRPAATAVGDLLRRVGAGPQPRHRGDARRHRGGRRDRRPAGAERLPRRLLRPGGVRRRRPAAAHALGRPPDVPRPARVARGPGRGRPPGPGRARRRRDRSLRRHSRHARADARRRGHARLPDRRGRRRRGRPRPRPPLQRAGPRRSVARRGEGRLGGTPRRRAGAHPRRRGGPAGEPLAALPGPRLPVLGAVGVLPVGRRLRVPRPAPGRHGPGPRRARDHPRAHPARGLAPVPRGRRPALVASAGGPRHPHADLRRPGLAAVRRRLLHRRHRRRGDPRRAGPLPEGAAAQARAGGRLRPGSRRRPARPALRALRCAGWIASTTGAPTACR